MLVVAMAHGTLVVDEGNDYSFKVVYNHSKRCVNNLLEI